MATKSRRKGKVEAPQQPSRKAEFIKALARYLVEDAGAKGIEIEMGGTWAMEWAKVRSCTPIFGYPTLEEAEATLTEFLK